MTPEDVQKMIQAGLPDCEVKVEGDGSHFEAVVIGEMFDGMSLVKNSRLFMPPWVTKLPVVKFMR